MRTHLDVTRSGSLYLHRGHRLNVCQVLQHSSQCTFQLIPGVHVAHVAYVDAKRVSVIIVIVFLQGCIGEPVGGLTNDGDTHLAKGGG